MEDSEIRHAVGLLATAYRELAVLVDQAELEAVAGHGSAAHALALRKACRDLSEFGEIVRSLSEEGFRQSRQFREAEELGSYYRSQLTAESYDRLELGTRLRAAERTQLEAVLRTQERLLREVGIDDATAARFVAECRDALRPDRERGGQLVWGRSLEDLFAELAAESCRLAEELAEPLPPEPEENERYFERVAALSDERAGRRARGRRVLRASLRALAAATAVGVGLVATPLLGVAAASVLVAVAEVVLDEAAAVAADAMLPAARQAERGEQETRTVERDDVIGGTVAKEKASEERRHMGDSTEHASE